MTKTPTSQRHLLFRLAGANVAVAFLLIAAANTPSLAAYRGHGGTAAAGREDGGSDGEHSGHQSSDSHKSGSSDHEGGGQQSGSSNGSQKSGSSSGSSSSSQKSGSSSGSSQKPGSSGSSHSPGSTAGSQKTGNAEPAGSHPTAAQAQHPSGAVAPSGRAAHVTVPAAAPVSKSVATAPASHSEQAAATPATYAQTVLGVSATVVSSSGAQLVNVLHSGVAASRATAGIDLTKVTLVVAWVLANIAVVIVLRRNRKRLARMRNFIPINLGTFRFGR
jgi:hypothetical protein